MCNRMTMTRFATSIYVSVSATIVATGCVTLARLTHLICPPLNARGAISNAACFSLRSELDKIYSENILNNGFFAIQIK